MYPGLEGLPQAFCCLFTLPLSSRGSEEASTCFSRLLCEYFCLLPALHPGPHKMMLQGLKSLLLVYLPHFPL